MKWKVDTFRELLAAQLDNKVSSVIIVSRILLTSNLTLKKPTFIEQGGIIELNGFLLSINSDFAAGNYQVFDAINGEVVFQSIPEVNARWWGNDSSAIQKAIECATDNVLLHGEWNIESAIPAKSNVSIKGAATILLHGNDFISLSDVSYFRVEDIYVSGSGGYAFHFVGNAGDVSIKNIRTMGVGGVIKIDNGAVVTHLRVESGAHYYNTEWHVDLADGAIINSWLFDSVRFEQNGPDFGAFRAIGNSYATGAIKFLNCVFEGQIAQYAVDLGDNPQGISFKGCHFEANAANGMDGGADIRIGLGTGTVYIEGCTFAPPQETSTNFYSLRVADSNISVVVKNNIVAGVIRPGYLGFIHNPYGKNVFLIGNQYSSDSFDYFSGIQSPQRMADGRIGDFGRTSSSIVKFVTTSNDSWTDIWGGQYQFARNRPQGILLVADIVAVDSTGDVYSAFIFREYLTTNTTNTATSRGNINDMSINSETMNARAVIVNNGMEGCGIKLQVLGCADTTIKWMADISLRQVLGN